MRPLVLGLAFSLVALTGRTSTRYFADRHKFALLVL